MSSVATSTLTLLFTDIEGSTALADRLGDAPFRDLLDDHFRILDKAIEDNGGRRLETTGDGLLAAFPTAAAGIRAAVAAQRTLAASAAAGGQAVRSRMAVHTGTALQSDDRYVGLDLHAAARIMALAHGAQVLVSQATRALVRDGSEDAWQFRDLGTHHLRGIEAPVRIFQVLADGLEAEFPAIRDVGERTGLPSTPWDIVGREADLALARDMLGTRRVVTITGPGGTGKTRLAVELARSIELEPDEEVAFVDLAAIREADAAIVAIARALRVGAADSPDPRPAIHARLAESAVLLVLDNTEQVAGAAAIVADLVARSETLRVVVTSRAPLHIRGEHDLPLGPLELPPVGAEDPAVVGKASAVALFVDRARASAPSFDLDAENVAAVAELVRRLDGLPLAIELVATHARILPPAVLLARLGSVLDLPGPHDLPDRQRTLRHTIEWSCALLTDEERRAFGRLGVFAGSWSLEAAEAVLADDRDVIAVLEALADRALVRPVRGIEPRVSMLGTISAYAAELLDGEPDADRVRDRHAAWYVDFAESVRERLVGSDQARALRLVEADIDNIRVAFTRFDSRHSTELGLRLGTALLPFGQVRAPYRDEIARRLEAFLSQPRDGIPPNVVAHALGAAAQYAGWQNDPSVTERYAQESSVLFESLGDQFGVADQIAVMGYAALGDDPALAEARLLDALARYRSLGGSPGESYVLGGLSIAAGQAGDIAGARRWIDEVMATWRRIGDPPHYWRGFALVGLGRVEQLEGNLLAACESFLEALGIFRTLDAPAGLSLALGSLADLVIDADDPEAGARLSTFAAVLAESSEPFGGTISGLRNPIERAGPRLDPARLDEAIRQGRAMTLDEAIAGAKAALRWRDDG